MKKGVIHLYGVNFKNIEKINQYEELIKVFLRPSEYVIIDDDLGMAPDEILTFNEENFQDKNEIKRQIYDKMAAITGKRPEWGILTGIRPVKLCGEIFDVLRDTVLVANVLVNEYYLSESKAELIINIYKHQQKDIGKPDHDSVGVYIGIPFCPTRCLYCSFASNQVKDSEIERYLVALHKEIKFVGRKIEEDGLRIESIYIGGGTPTTLTAHQLEALLGLIENSFNLNLCKEFTVEAGRPDTITLDKLHVLKNHNITRISINPQTMKDETLKTIGRNHSVEETCQAFKLAKAAGMTEINGDIIAGLPGENLYDFKNSLDRLILMGASNITVHTLAVKRASRLVEVDSEYHYKGAEEVEKMLDYSREKLNQEGLIPYYLYRQKHMMGAQENTGYCKPGHDCIYNVRIMEERQSIIALGAGGISKVYFPQEDRLERVANVTNYQEYISRIDEMLDRKEKNLFRR